MPPKTPKTPKTNGEVSEDGKNIIVLCHMMMYCDSFEVNSSKLAPVLGISHAKNVPRKINSIINPYGFEFKSNKITKKNDIPTAAIPVIPDQDGQDAPATASSKKKKLNEQATPTPKKRKMDEVTAHDNDAACDAGEA